MEKRALRVHVVTNSPGLWFGRSVTLLRPYVCVSWTRAPDHRVWRQYRPL